MYPNAISRFPTACDVAYALQVKGVNMSSADYRKRVLPIGALYAASLWLSNSAYLHLSVSFIQMTKALMPGLVYMIGCFMHTEPYSAKVRRVVVVGPCW